jgi:hypothetical protein
MQLNWVDCASIGVVAVVAAIQFLRATRDFSRILYETIFFVGAVVLASRLFELVHALTHISYAVSFLALFLTGAALAVVLAALLNTVAGFGFGAFSYVFGLILGVGCGYAVGHVAIRTPYIAFAYKDPQFLDAVRRSWMARDLLYFRTFVELLAILRNARWLNI